MAWLDGYTYRKAINITGQGSAGTNFQIAFRVGESSGATGEDFDVEEHCENFPTDIRFTDNDGETELDYYIENMSGTTPNRVLDVWVKVTDDLSSNQSIYIYYGKVGDSSGSDGDAVFPTEFSGFENTTDGYSGAASTDQQIERAYSLKVASGFKEVALSKPYVAEVWLYNLSNASGDEDIGFYPLEDNLYARVSMGYPTSGEWGYRNSAGWQNTNEGFSYETWYRLKIVINSDGTFSAWAYDTAGNETTLCEDEDRAGDAVSDRLGFYVGKANNTYADAVRVRKFADPEPVFASAGAEEEGITEFTESVTDSLTLVPTQEFSGFHANHPHTDSIALVGTILKKSTWAKSFIDAVSLSDIITRIKKSFVSITDTLTLRDIISIKSSWRKIFTNTITLVETTSKKLGFKKALTNTITLADTITKKSTWDKVFTETIILRDVTSFVERIWTFIVKSTSTWSWQDKSEEDPTWTYQDKSEEDPTWSWQNRNQ